MRTHYASINGAITPSEKATVSIFDHGLLYGDGLYETIRTSGGDGLRFDAHMARLRSGAEALGLHNAVAGFDFSGAIADLLKANGLLDARIRITITRGRIAEPGVINSGICTPTIVITADPLPEFVMETSRAIISSYRRDEKSPLSGIKTLNCLPSVMARLEAQTAGFDDAILLNTQGHVAEGTTANVFMVTGSRMTTPALDQGCLPGTIRSAVLEIAPSLGLAVEETAIWPDALLEADELFFSSAIKLLRPITHLSGNQIGDGSHRICEKILSVLLEHRL